MPRPKKTRAAEGTTTIDPRSLGADCDRCPLKRCEGPVFGKGYSEATVAIIGEGPGLNEVKQGVPFVGMSGEELDEQLKKVGLTRAEVYVDNATLEFPPGGNLEDFLALKKREAKAEGLPFVHPVDACRPRLFAALGIPRCSVCSKWAVGPVDWTCSCQRPKWVHSSYGLKNLKVVVPVGNAALKALLGIEGISKWRGSPINWFDFAKRQGFFAFAGGVSGAHGGVGGSEGDDEESDDE